MIKHVKIYISLISAAVLTLALLPGIALAQGEKDSIDLRLVYMDYDKKVKPGEESILYLEVHNYGETPITNIRFSAEPEEGWDIEFSPAVISSLSPDSHQTIDIIITPDNQAARGNHWFRITAQANETRQIITAYVNIDTATTIWTWIGAGIAVLVIAAFIFVFRYFNKQ